MLILKTKYDESIEHVIVNQIWFAACSLPLVHPKNVSYKQYTTELKNEIRNIKIYLHVPTPYTLFGKYIKQHI